MKWQSANPYDPRSSPPHSRAMAPQEGAPRLPPPPPPMPHHHRPRHLHDSQHLPTMGYRQGYGHPRHPPPPPPQHSSRYEHSQYYEYHRTSNYPPPPRVPPSRHTNQYRPPPRHYSDSTIDPRSSPPASPPSVDPFRTGGCTCKKSRCLKLYCQCFALSTTCGPKCKCQTCHNTTLHAEDIDEARKTILERNPSAFDDKFRGSPTPSPYRPAYSPPPSAWSHTYPTHHPAPPIITTAPPPPPPPAPPGPPPRVNKFGCKCRRSFCLKKYCECYQNSVHCGLNCRCLNCKNFPKEDGTPPKGPAPAVPSSIASSPRSVSDETLISKYIEKKDDDSQIDEPADNDGNAAVDSAELEEEDSGEASTDDAPKTLELSQDRMAIMAAVAMTELFGKSPRRVSIDGTKGGTASTTAPAIVSEDSYDGKRKADDVVSAESSPEQDGTLSKRQRTDPEDSPVRSIPESRNPSPVSYGTPQNYHHRPLHPHHHRPPLHHHRHHHHHHRLPPPQHFPYYHSPPPPPPPPPRTSPTYEDVVKSSGLPKSLSFRKICSKCGKTRGEHGELGFGNKCVYQDCGKCGAGVHMHQKAGSPMGILCRLTVDEGATPGASLSYERKIRDLAARAELQKSLLEDKKERAERMAQTYP